MRLPDTYEGDEARVRIEDGLRRAGCSKRVAVEAARLALLQAPFVPPDDAGWRWVCQLAREAASGLDDQI